jgi:hypothetical protein
MVTLVPGVHRLGEAGSGGGESQAIAAFALAADPCEPGAAPPDVRIPV